MSCNYPEHHGGGWAGPVVAVFAAMVAAAVIGPLLHWILLALAVIGAGAAIAGVLWVRAQVHEGRRMRHLIQQGAFTLPPPQQQRQPVQQQAPAQLPGGGTHQHVHFHGLQLDEIAEVMRRQIRGGQQ